MVAMSEPEQEKGRQIKATLRGYTLWAFDRVREDQGNESDAVMYIIGRFLDNREEVAAFKIGREEFRSWKGKGKS